MKHSSRSLPLLTAILALCVAPSHAQVSFGGSPIGTGPLAHTLAEAPVLWMGEVDVAALIAEDELRHASGIKGPWRFGTNHVVDIGLDNAGTWSELRAGDRLWRQTIACPGAYSINIEFHEYRMPEGAMLFVYNDLGDVLGAFTAESNPGHESLGVWPLPGERLTIEYYEPAAARGQGMLRVGQVTHGYRDLFALDRDFGSSGDCNINSICPLGDGWRDQIRSVALIVVGGSGACTGQLINNCAQDGTPYFLTADHCLTGPVDNWVFRFNWESPECDPTQNAPTDQTVSGSQLLVASANTDVALLLLNSTPPEEYNVFYSGWDITGNPPQSSIAIHHPAGDIKKISADYDAATQTMWQGADCWRVGQWEEGTTEPGSSGSGLWNEMGLLVGQLFGGTASCSQPNGDDYYGRFNVSYPLMQEWLGDCGELLGGSPDGSIPGDAEWDAGVTSITQVPEVLCGTGFVTPRVTIKNDGSNPIQSLTLTYGTDDIAPIVEQWIGNILPGQTHNHQLTPFVAGSGMRELTVSCASPSGNDDPIATNDTIRYAFRIADPGLAMQLRLTQDLYGQDITWELTDDEGEVLYSGGPYPNMADGAVRTSDFCLADGCYTFTIMDSFGDGICCGNGEGSYTIEDEEGNEWVSGDGQFAFMESHTFCIEGVGIQGYGAAFRFEAWPNPAQDILNVRLPEQLPTTAELRLLDATGRVAQAWRSGPSDVIRLHLPPLANGLYFLEVTADGMRGAQRIILSR